MPLFQQSLKSAGKEKATALQHVIRQTDADIDAMVYQLYSLTEAEIAIVEGR